jgi:hypothetical protein
MDAPRRPARGTATRLLLAAALLPAPGAPAEPPNGTAGDAPPLEYRIKAAMLYNFARFVEWPAAALGDPAAPLAIGVWGDDPFAGALEDAVRGKTAWGRAITVKNWKDIPAGERIHILFVSRSEEKRLAAVLATAESRPWLTVSDIPRFTASGGVIGFFLEDNKVRFAVNRTAAARAGLTVSSKLLRLAATEQEAMR